MSFRYSEYFKNISTHFPKLLSKISRKEVTNSSAAR